MIHQFNFGSWKKARLWCNQLPFRLDDCKNKMTGLLPSANPQAVEDFQICMEISLPGNCSNYGLLGLEYTPLNGLTAAYEIPYLDACGEDLDDHIAPRSDRICAGISREYAVAIAETIHHLDEAGKLPVGRYCFAASAAGMVGSSPAIFRKLAQILIQLSFERPHGFDFERMRSLISDYEW